MTRLLDPEYNPTASQVVGGQFHRYLVSRKDTYVVHAHLSRNMPQYDVAIFEFHPKRSVGEIINNLALHLDDIFFGHIPAWVRSSLAGGKTRALEISLLEQTLVLVCHDVGLNLRHEIHGHHHNNEQRCPAKIKGNIPL